MTQLYLLAFRALRSLHSSPFIYLKKEQLRALNALLTQKSVIAYLPTGYGKSLIFQIYSKIRAPVLVVTPLTSLNEDQALRAKALGIRSLSHPTPDAWVSLLSELTFLSPESLLNTNWKHALAKAPPTLVVFDEAHCIDDWGHSFRPDYAEAFRWISKIKDSQIPLLLLTGSPSPKLRRFLSTSLTKTNRRALEIKIADYSRPDLSLHSIPHLSESEKFISLLETLKAHPLEKTIVYCLTRSLCESVSLRLQKEGIQAEPYHAGLSSYLRKTREVDFREDSFNPLVSASAFGMGIDLKNLRRVIHFGVPPSPEDYLQQIGRAGRDGAGGEALILWSPSDFQRAANLLESSQTRLAPALFRLLALKRILTPTPPDTLQSALKAYFK